MTKNHILIRSVALGALLLFSPLANASVDRVLVTYFNVLYKSQSPKCSIDDATKTRILAELEPKCLIRTTAANGEQFISGAKPDCGEIYVKAAVDTKVQSLCANTAAVQQDKLIAQQQAAAAKQQAAAASGKSDGGNSGGSSLSDVVKMAKEGRDLYKKADKVYDNREEYKEKAQKGWSKLTGKDDKSDKTTTAGKESAPGTTPGVTPPGTPAGTGFTPVTTNYSTPDGGKIQAVTLEDGGTKLTKYDSTGKVLDSKEMGKGSTGDQLGTQVKEMGGDPNTAQAQPNPELQQAAKEVPKPVQEDAAKVADGKPDAPDKELEARHAKSKQEDQTLLGQIQAIRNKLDVAKNALGPEASADCTANEATRNITTPDTANPPKAHECAAAKPQTVINCVEKELVALEKEKAELQKDKESCSNSSAQAEKLCSVFRNEKAQQVQQMMSVGSAVLSKVTAASEACGATSTLSKVAQGGMLAAQGSCTAMKYRCDFSCASAKRSITKMKAKVEAIKACQASTLLSAQNTGKQIDMAAEELAKTLGMELQPEKSVPSAIAQCEKHKADIMGMGLTALGLLSAHLDAKKCKEQLDTGNGNGGTNSTSALAGAQITTAEYCSQPSNASSTMCKCTANPTADGCMGGMSGSGLSLGKVNTNGTLSGFAGPGKGNGTSLSDAAKKAGDSEELAPGAGLSEAAREALGIGSAGSVGAGGGGGGGESAPEVKDQVAKEEKEKSKFGFMSSIGSMFSGGSKPAQAAKAAIRGYEQDQAIKRKVASEQIRSQITTASGKSNFDKIKSRYQSNVSSFEQ